jgi:hypothetical protein
MDFLEKARQIESKITQRMAGATRNLVQSAGTREPLELVGTILEAVEREIQSGGRGTRVFPFNTIDVTILAPTDRDRARLEAIVDGDTPLAGRVADRLRAAGCSRPDLAVHVSYIPRAQKHWTDQQFSLAFSRVARRAAVKKEPQAPSFPRIAMTITRGAAAQQDYVFACERIDLGRGVEVRDNRTGLIRTNHVAFSEAGDEGSRTISRQHAHLLYHPQTHQFRLFDDGSVHGTRIVRNGKTLPVPRGSRGIRVQSCDEICLGDACLRINLDTQI